MGKLIVIFIILFLSTAALSGCASIQKKFTRKTTQKGPVLKFYQDKDFKRAPNAKLYKEHISYFRSWMDDLLETDSLNYKADLRSVSEAIRHLSDMKRCLSEEMQIPLKKHMDDLAQIADKISQGTVKVKENPRMMHTLRTIKRDVENNYSFNKVKDYILKD